MIFYGSYLWRQSDTFFGIWPRKLLYVLRLLKRFWWIAHLNSKQEAALWSSRSWIVPTHPLLMNFHLSNFDIENLHTAPDGRLHSGPIVKTKFQTFIDALHGFHFRYISMCVKSKFAQFYTICWLINSKYPLCTYSTTLMFNILSLSKSIKAKRTQFQMHKHFFWPSG